MKSNLTLPSCVLLTDHTITLVDIRKFSEPFMILKGHRKAVSYVHYLPEEELLVSA